MPLSKIEQSSVNSGVAGTGQVAAAYVSANQTITAATSTKVNFDTLASFGTATNSWNITNKRFTPTVAGYYQIEGCVYSTSSFGDQSLVLIYKNGSIEVRCQDTGSKTYNLSFNSVVYCNGTTDYLEIYVYASAGNTLLGGNTDLNWVRSYMVRAA